MLWLHGILRSAGAIHMYIVQNINKARPSRQNWMIFDQISCKNSILSHFDYNKIWKSVQTYCLDETDRFVTSGDSNFWKNIDYVEVWFFRFSTIMEILEIEVFNILYNPGDIWYWTFLFSLILEMFDIGFLDFLISWKYWKRHFCNFLLSWQCGQREGGSRG